MKFNKKITFALLLAPATLLAACGGNNDTTSSGDNAGGDTASSVDTSGAETIKVWVSEVAGVADSFRTMCETWAKDNNVNYKFDVVGVTEAESATQMLTDVSAGADIYCFAQDQFSRLVQGGALSKLGVKASEFVTANNTAESVRAATSGEDIYAYPLTADNGYFMYYNKDIIDESHIDSLEDIIQDCEDAGYKFSMETETSAWYLASFFMAREDGKPDSQSLCKSSWTTNEKGAFTGVDDTWNSDNGVIAARGIQHLVKSTAANSSSTTADLSAATPSAVLVSGTWAYNDVKTVLGDNMGVADLPSFKVDDKSYHLGSYSGFKLMGVKPQSDTVKASNLNKLVQYLTNYDNELTRLKDLGWGPSNKEAQASKEYQENPALVALAEQTKYATAQGNIHGSWWDIAKVVATSLKAVEQDDETGIKAALQAYEDKIDGLFTMSEETKRAFTVTGAIKSENMNWDSDLTMTEDPTNTWTSKAITLAEGDEFKVRQGLSWDVSFGKDGGNYTVSAEEAGTKKIQFVATVDGDGKVTGGTISLIAA